MQDKPILLFADKDMSERTKRMVGIVRLNFPDKTKQINRLSPKFSTLQSAWERGNLVVQNSPNAIEPEYSLIFEIAGDVASFYTAVNCLNNGTQKKFTPDGFAEIVLDLSDSMDVDNDFYCIDNKTGERLKEKTSMRSKLYCVSTNGKALQELLSLWKSYSTNPDFEFPKGKTGFRTVFNQLYDIRQWGIKERLEESGILEDWIGMMPDNGWEKVLCEVELFYTQNHSKRQLREDIVSRLVSDENGRVINSCIIAEINYHGLLIELPRKCVEKIVAKEEVKLVNSEQIMFFHTTGQIFDNHGQSFQGNHAPTSKSPQNLEPIVALFDGLPQENHPYLQNYLIVDDPENYAQNYLVATRQHGTAMASLIIHGDLNNNKFSSSRKIYVRPIMRPDFDFNGNALEIVPKDVLLVDTIHTAVRRLFEPSLGAVAPQVKIINLSIGDKSRVFIKSISPLARLLDWLSYKYNVLFIVSSGNHYSEFDIGETFESFARKDLNERSNSILNIVDQQSRINRLLSPAASINALTIGAAFADYSALKEDSTVIAPCIDGAPHPISAVGRGINKSIKPDIIYFGGRNTIKKSFSNPNMVLWRDPVTREPGILSAAPFSAGDRIETYSYGTSNATALISHEATYCYDILEALVKRGYNIDSEYFALLIKAMLTHGARWDDKILELYTQIIGKDKSDVVHKYLGYGFPDIRKACECSSQKAILLGFGDLKDGQADIYKLPLPFDFAKNKLERRLTLTLASFSPIISNRQKYRSVQVWATLEDTKSHWTRKNADWQAVLRGTLQHEIFDNNQTEVWGENDCLAIKVNCRNDADPKSTSTTKYALMVSFEIKEPIDYDVYEKIAERVRPKVAPKP